MKPIFDYYKGWHFRAAMPVTDKYMTLINKDYVYEFVDEAYCRIIGKRHNEVLNNIVIDIWGEANFQKIIKQCIDRCFTGVPVEHEGWINVLGNGKRYYKIHYFPYKNEDGNTTHVISALWDMTEAKQEEEIFSKCNQDFLKKIQKKYFGVIFCDPHGRFIFVNNVVLEKTGFDRNWFDAKTIYDFVLPEEKNNIYSCFNACLQGKQMHNYEFSYKNALGEVNWIKTDFTPIYEKGAVSGIVGIIHDITKLK
ncbi:MAG TPA: PAS domain-containing protein [Syntrophorhabdaceae bacterium]|nr:PAS domain-containing protein [Syntrophorhabdaceae bacterium]